MERFEIDMMLVKEVQAGKGCIQNPFHEFDVYDHTLVMVNEVKKLTTDKEVIAAAWLHDIGKPVVAEPRIKNGEIMFNEHGQQYQTFPDHEVVGEKMVHNLDQQLFIRHELSQARIAKLVGSHFLPMKGIKKMRKTASWSDFIQAFKDLETTLDQTGDKVKVLTMFVADTIAKGQGAEDIAELMAIRQAYLDQDNQDLLIRIYKIQQAEGLKDDDRYAKKDNLI